MKDSDLPDYYPLLVRIAEDNHKAFSTLYDMYSYELIRYVLKKVDQIVVAEDIVQDLFLSLWKKRKILTEIESIPAYLYTSCRYLVIAHYRKSLKNSYQEIGKDELEMINLEQPLEDRLYYRYILDIVSTEIENLPAKCKEVFKMSRQLHMTNKEIADELKISESTVENHINKAIGRLRSSTKHILNIFIFFY